METTWEVLFTPEFGKELKRIPESRVDKLLEKLEQIRRDPYSKIPQVTALRSRSRLFRVRVGDWRFIYRVAKKLHRVIFIRAAPRGEAYRPLPHGGLPRDGMPPEEWLPQGGHSEPVQMAANGTEKTDSSVDADALDDTPDSESHGRSEPLLDEHELHLMGVSQAYWARISALTDPAELGDLAIPAQLRARLEDYITAPGQSQIGKLYRLEPQQGFPDIAREPLSAFLLALDPEQREIVEKPLDKGPMLVRGGPGTGKTLIALHRLHRIWSERASESLFDEGRKPWFAFVTYNRSLVKSNELLFKGMVRASDTSRVRFETLDSVVAGMIKKYRDRLPAGLRSYSVPSDRELKEILSQVLTDHRAEPSFPKESHDFIDRHGLEFLIDEFEQVIKGNAIRDVAEYLALRRVGRSVRLGRNQRQIVWSLYDRWCAALRELQKETWEGRRLGLLGALEKGTLNFSTANAIVVDEVQDFTPTAIRLLLKLVRDPRFLLLSADAGQSIYNRSVSWKDIAPELRFHSGNSFILRRSWRMTREIDTAVSSLRTASEADADSDFGCEAVLSGPRPIWITHPRWEHLQIVSGTVCSALDEQRVNPGQIAVICRFKSQVNEVIQALEFKGIPVDRVDRDRPLNSAVSRVHVMNVHSAKGLEFPFVLVPFVGEGVYPNSQALRSCRDDEERQEALDKERRLLYVALSRASRFLWLISDTQKPSPFLEALNTDDWDAS